MADSPSDSVFFCFADPAGFSGQKAATEVVIKGLSSRGWRCRRMPQPVLQRGAGAASLARYAFGIVLAWTRSVRLLFAGGSRICVNMGQTRTAFVRDLVPLVLGRICLGKERVVVSLHSSLFMTWGGASIDSCAFRTLLGNAGTVTVLGESQRDRIIELGLQPERVKVVVNTCDLRPISMEAVTAKYRRLFGSEAPIRILFLSSLIDTKGFPEYLEALERISARPGPRIEAALCGPLTSSEFSGRFSDPLTTGAWIDGKLESINRCDRVRIRWIKGAVGTEKAALFEEAHIFVLPTRYAVEAQPIVLLEAMASGCAIVTSRIGEIPTILNEGCAVMLGDPSAEAVAGAVEALVSDPGSAARLALAAHERFQGLYAMDRHIDRWESLLRGSP
jgi:glycosyltransferase involved in cell wall biosynthesis